jgi:hypothetical protein
MTSTPPTANSTEPIRLADFIRLNIEPIEVE